MTYTWPMVSVCWILLRTIEGVLRSMDAYSTPLNLEESRKYPGTRLVPVKTHRQYVTVVKHDLSSNDYACTQVVV